jgi:multidrug efflux pump subunit AcrA (membrane-fusion protein)
MPASPSASSLQANGIPASLLIRPSSGVEVSHPCGKLRAGSSAGKQEAGSSTPLRFAQNDKRVGTAQDDRKDGTRCECLRVGLNIPIVAFYAFVLLALTGCGPKVPVAADQVVPVRVRAPIRTQQPVSVAASGAVEANVTAQSAFQIAGRVAKVLVEEGQAVKQGQVLAELDATDYRNGYDAAQAQADAAQAVDRKAQEGPRAQELEQARIDFEQWQDQYKRMKYLYDHKSLPANDFKKIEAGYQAAQQRYEMARQGTRVEDKEAATRAVPGGGGADARGREAAGRHASCVAPIAGFVGMRRIDVGDTVGPGRR